MKKDIDSFTICEQKEIPGVKEQRLQIDKGKDSQLPKSIMRVYK
jgi:hypothetical protein